MRIETIGTDAAVRRLSVYKNALGTKCRLLLSELSKLGIDTAGVNFKRAIYDGANDVEVSPEPEWQDDHTLFLCASGCAILFIEFGAGVHYAEPAHPEASAFGAVRGEYGQGKGKRDSWGYYGEPGTNGRSTGENLVLTHGNPANRSMYDAGEAMRAQILSTAREVWSDD